MAGREKEMGRHGGELGKFHSVRRWLVVKFDQDSEGSGIMSNSK
jgi:hypothetical protein